MLWLIRFIPVAFFSLTALSLVTFQSLEIVHAFFDIISNKTDVK
ncbi:hypothetical protein [Heyndrickxia ginsengihumi]|nr:hypothetical protein [Heyndrickxia ginsengihumi]